MINYAQVADEALQVYAAGVIGDDPTLDIQLKQSMMDDIIKSAHAYINKYLVASLTAEQVVEFNDFLGTKPTDDDIVKFFVNHGVNVSQVIFDALSKLKESYQG